MIYLFFGQPCSGKTTLATYLTQHKYSAEKVIHIDGDEYRQIIGNTGYDKESRIQNLKSAFNTALFLDSKGYIVILSFVTPYVELRTYLFERKPETKFIYLDYQPSKDSRGREKFHVPDFEEPTYEELINPNFTHINTTKVGKEQSFKKIRLL
jgi:adenylylsulfate kinase